ncbi:hypothetical protein M5689_011601 [Euphorbia peplus]|nr:hypothetical protein M5689_011601 [Euphorbia peplus]
MSAIVCGKRSFFEELTVTSPPVSKRIRCSSSSPVRFSPPRPNSVTSPSSNSIDKLIALFPDMDNQILERALEECGNDIDSAIRSLTELRLGSIDNNLDPSAAVATSDVLYDPNLQQGVAINNAEAPPTDDPQTATQLEMGGAEWVELFVREMKSAADMDDARARASRALEVLEKSICARAGAETAKNFQQENMMLKEQLQSLIQENTLLKRAVTIQHERQKEYEDRSQELQHLKQLVSQYQDQLRALEVSNYALTMHLKQAQQSSSMPGRFHPDVF